LEGKSSIDISTTMWNVIHPHLRLLVLVGVFITLGIVASVGASDEVEAWTSTDANVAYGRNYDTACSYWYQSTGDRYMKYFYWDAFNVEYDEVRVGSTGTDYYTGAYMTYYTHVWDDRTYIDRSSGSFSYYALVSSGSSITFSIYLVTETDLTNVDARRLPEIIETGRYLEQTTLTSRSIERYTVDLDPTDLAYINSAISRNQSRIHFAFVGSGSPGLASLFSMYRDSSSTPVFYRSYISFNYDDMAPHTPSLDPMSAYITGDQVPVTWSTVSDNPSGGNRGEVTYQVGVYLPGAPTDNPYHTSTWVDATSWDLTGVVENVQYTFRVRARDGSGFFSNWSAPVNTTIDNSPPTVPAIFPEEPYEERNFEYVRWLASTDAGSGNVSYNVQMSLNLLFEPIYTLDNLTTEPLFGYMGLISNTTYYWRVRARDDLGHWSAWSLTISTTIENEPPTVPIPMEMPSHSMGKSTTFKWHPSLDRASGVMSYHIEVATDPDFTSGPWVEGTYLESFTTSRQVDDLKDGVTYYYRVKAQDNMNHFSQYSKVVSSAQDASPPLATNVHPLPDFIPEGPLTISWDPALDHGVGVSHYELWYHIQGPPGSSPMVYSIEVIGQSLTFPDLGEGTWIFGIMAVDRFGHQGPWTGFNTTVDGTPPSQPFIKGIPRYSSGPGQTINWTPCTDEGSGVDHFVVEYAQAGNMATIQYVVTQETEVTIVGLMEGVLYWFRVWAFDAVGNSNEGNDVHVILDLTPPPAPELIPVNELGSRDLIKLQWIPVVDNNGSDVEYQVRGMFFDMPRSTHVDIEYPWTNGTNVTIEGMSELEFYELYVVARDPLGWESEPSNMVSFSVDLTPPRVSIRTPIEGQSVSGSIMIHAEVDDVNPWGYFMQYARDGGPRDWKYIVYWTEMGNSPWFFAPWDTAGLPDGEYVIRVTHIDYVGRQGYNEVNVTLINAKPRVTPSDITFSDTSPKKGDMVTVYVTVRNAGDSAAYNLMVELFDDGVLVGSFPGVLVRAHSYIELPFDIEVDDRHEFTVKVGSIFLYEAEETHRPRILIAQEEDEAVSVSSPVAWVGILAIVLSVIAIALNLVGRRTSGAEAPKGSEEDLRVESEEGNEKGTG